MDIRRHFKISFLPRIDLVPFFNVIFLVLVFLMMVFSFALSSSLNVKLPRAVTSDMVHDGSITVVVTSENIMYVNEKVTTLGELRSLLTAAVKGSRSILIKADRRASVGRVVDIWDLARGLGIERINVAADQEP